MTEQIQTPDIAADDDADDTEGHKVRARDDEDTDDTEGHKVRSRDDEDDTEVDDVEGHTRRV